MAMPTLLGIDLGVACGFALYREDGRLQWHRSQNLGSVARVRQAVPSLLHSIPGLSMVVAEGGGEIAEIWRREADRFSLPFQLIDAATWRRDLLYEREQRTGTAAKQSAEPLAYKVIRWSGLPSPRTLRHDAAEAILVGLWGVMKNGWLIEQNTFLNTLRNLSSHTRKT